MNKVSFTVLNKRKYQSGHEESTINISVDEKPLAEHMEAYEMPMAMKEGHPGLAGNYHPITTASSSLKQYYLGKYDACWGYDKNKTELLGCKCGNRYCWPLLCKISIQNNKVIWSEFEQPHRDDYWDYSDFEGFVFDKQQYLNAIEAMNKA